ncbi:uridine kinase [Firmicutes bacterium CAG:631]|nr:uridine kinase [Firmicutes bacterium CAG:631]
MKPILIIVAGGSASGKSTVVNEIIERLKSVHVAIIKHDDYYVDLTNMPMEERKLVNYDHPSSLDNELLYQHLQDLLNNKAVLKPTYDFIEHNRNTNKELLEPKKVIILEGILSLVDKRIRDLASIKIFVELDDDLRFIRRLTRDINERGRSVESVIQQYLTTVKPMYHKYVKPQKKYCDIIIPNDKSHDVAVDVIVCKIKDILNQDV